MERTSHPKIGIVCCSNGQKKESRETLGYLESTLRGIGLQPVFSDYIYETDGISSGTAQERAQALMDFYMDDGIEAIFDISGGDLANGVLPYLDYEAIANSTKAFWGYSDLTTVINAIYAKTGKASVLYQVRNLVYAHKERQLRDFTNTFLNHGKDLFNIQYHFIQQEEMRGTVIGGNIRCLLKLAGTEYMPDFTGKILLLESRSGTAAQMEAYLCQLEQLGAFRKVSGILLGTFTQMEAERCQPPIEALVQKFAGEGLPIAATKEIGHGTDAKGMPVGLPIYIR